MKRLLITLFALINSLFLFSQQWAMDEVAEDVQSSEPITVTDIIVGVIFFGLLFLFYKFAKLLRSLSKDEYKDVLKRISLTVIGLGIIMCIVIQTHHEIKFSSLKDDAEHGYNTLCNDNDVFVDFSFEQMHSSVYEIHPNEFDIPGNLIDYGILGMLSQNNRLVNKPNPIDGVYRSFSISSGPTLMVWFAGEANRALSAQDNPYLYYCMLRPYRIRYFTERANPESDVIASYPYFRDEFLKQHNITRVNDFLDGLETILHNEYFTIRPTSGGDELWRNYKIMYECDPIPERVYDYARLNFGDFEIMYCVTRPSRFGLEEKYDRKKIWGKEFFDHASKLDLMSQYAKYMKYYLILVFMLVITFIAGKPKK